MLLNYNCFLHECAFVNATYYCEDENKVGVGAVKPKAFKMVTR